MSRPKNIIANERRRDERFVKVTVRFSLRQAAEIDAALESGETRSGWLKRIAAGALAKETKALDFPGTGKH